MTSQLLALFMSVASMHHLFLYTAPSTVFSNIDLCMRCEVCMHPYVVLRHQPHIHLILLGNNHNQPPEQLAHVTSRQALLNAVSRR